MSEASARIEGTRKLLQDFIAPEVGALVIRINALEKRVEEMLKSLEDRTGAKVERVDSKLDRTEERITARMDALEQRLNTRINKLEAKMDARFDAVDSRLAAVDVRFETMERTMKENQAELMRQFSTLINFAAITERLNRLEDKTRTLGPGQVV